MRAFTLAIFAFALALGFGHRAHADIAPPSPIGGTCVPDSATVRAGLYETAGFGVRFSGNSVGKIRLLCPLGDVWDDKFGSMAMSVIDADGMEAGGRIRAHLHRAAKGTNVWIEIGTCDSNTSNTRTPHRLVCPFPSFQTSIFEWYWWDVEIERTTSNVNVEFLGVEVLYDVGELRPRGRGMPNPSGGERR